MLNVGVTIAHGHRVEVAESAISRVTTEYLPDEQVHAIVDLDTGIEYRFGEIPAEGVKVWTGRVLRCTLTFAEPGETYTTLLVDPITPGAMEAKAALRGADAAAEAARIEAGRWGGADRVPAAEPERFW